jgi:phospholipid/cholesterol/gamma-HCH transport system substrate-binding protein
MAANNEHLASLMTYADRDSRELQPVVQELRTMLPQLSRATTDLESLSRAITELANRVSRDPSVLLRGMAVPPGPGER